GVEVVASDVSEDLRRLRLASLGRPSEVEFLKLDVTRTDDVVAAVAERGITHVVHLAGLQVPFCAANPPLGAMVNVVGTVNVFEAVKRAGRAVGLAYASSAAVYGASAAYSAGLVSDDSALAPDSHYGVYKQANEGTARIYSTSDGIGSVGLRPFVAYGLGRDQGMTSEPTKAMLAAAAGRPYHMRFGGNVLLTHAEDCARTFIAASRAAAGSGDAVVVNVPGRRAGIAEVAALIESIVPAAKGTITWEPKPLPVPALIGPPAIEAVIGSTFNRDLRSGVASTIEQFRRALEAGLVAEPEA
ncbi:MAG TPA: SDR family oxidoreductase, partial [Acidimicrobiales bacterium]|nr:SDR family oxidoreductase [Acidimicrobiales bacterium]